MKTLHEADAANTQSEIHLKEYASKQIPERKVVLLLSRFGGEPNESMTWGYRSASYGPENVWFKLSACLHSTFSIVAA